MPDEIFRIESRRFTRAKRVQTVQHVIAAIMLVTAAIGHLTDPNSHHYVLPILELLAGVLLIGTVIVEKIRHRAAKHSRLGWIELAGAAMTFVEAMAKLQEPHRLSFYILSFLPPVMLLLFGIFDMRLTEAMFLRATDDSFEYRLRPIRRLRRVAWADMRGYRMSDKAFEIDREDGGVTTLKLGDVKNRDAAKVWLEEQFRLRLPPQELPGGERRADQG